MDSESTLQDSGAPGSSTLNRASLVNGVTFVAVYVDDLQSALHFYRDVLGLEKQSDMGDNACYLTIDDNIGLYIEAGNIRNDVTATSTRSSFGLTATSVVDAYAKLRDAGIRLVHIDGPMDMGNEQAWFQCYDPAGNIIEIVGPR